MRKYPSLLLCIGLIWAEEKNGDPSNLSFPGGYMSISYEFDIKKRIKGYQFSMGFAIPSIGIPGQGPYLFPGLSLGKRYVLQQDKSYHYSDLQLNFLGYGGLWGGAGGGISFHKGKKLKRRKFFIGYLMGGLVREYNRSDKAHILKNNSFKGYHLGLAFPLIGNHFYP